MKEKYFPEPGTDALKVIQLLEDKLYEYNRTRVNKDDGNLFSRIVRDDNQDIIAGIAGWTWSGICEITQFWVDEKARKKGIGKLLLEAAESEAAARGCCTILVRSYSFQAHDFYIKFGYQIEHILKNFPAGYNYFILTKKLTE